MSIFMKDVKSFNQFHHHNNIITLIGEYHTTSDKKCKQKKTITIEYLYDKLKKPVVLNEHIPNKGYLSEISSENMKFIWKNKKSSDGSGHDNKNFEHYSRDFRAELISDVHKIYGMEYTTRDLIEYNTILKEVVSNTTNFNKFVLEKTGYRFDDEIINNFMNKISTYIDKQLVEKKFNDIHFTRHIFSVWEDINIIYNVLIILIYGKKNIMIVVGNNHVDNIVMWFDILGITKLQSSNILDDDCIKIQTLYTPEYTPEYTPLYNL